MLYTRQIDMSINLTCRPIMKPKHSLPTTQSGPSIAIGHMRVCLCVRTKTMDLNFGMQPVHRDII